MGREQILNKIKEIVRDALDDENVDFEEETAIEQLGDWDSVIHMTIMAAVEMEMGVRLDIDEIIGVKRIGDIVQSVVNKKEVL